MSEDGFYGSGGASGATPLGGGTCGVGSIWDKLNVLEFNQNKILARLEWLESAQEEKSEPYDVMDSFRSSKSVDCLSKEQVSDKLIFNKQREIEELKQLAAEKQKALELAWQDRDQLKRTVNQQAASMHNLYTKNQQLEQTVSQQAVSLNNLYPVTSKNNELEKKIEELEYKIKGDEESYRIQQRLLKSCEDRVKELSQDNAALQIKLNYHTSRSHDYYERNNHLREENHKLKEELSQWGTVLTERKEAIRLNDVMQEKIEELQKENSDLRWRFDNPDLVEKQAARECTEIVNRIKNDSLTMAVRDTSAKQWMAAICEDIESEIKKEFNLR